MARKNPLIKKSNTELEYTPEQIQELAKCKKDPIYFITTYIKVTHPIRGLIPFDLYDYQREIVDMYKKNRFNILLASRQVGKTETSSAYLLWYAMFNKRKNILILSNKGKNAMELIEKIQNMYEELPFWLKPGIMDDHWNKHTIGFENKTRIMAETTTKDSGRSFRISLLYLDEFAFVSDSVQEEFWRSIFPTLATGGSAIISSTPNGDTNKFAQLWREAETNQNNFANYFVPWNAPPGRDEEFKEATISDLGMLAWLQEYECKFLAAENNIFDLDVINKYIQMAQEEKFEFEIEGQGFWEKIDRNGKYLISLDPAKGTGQDYSVIQVFSFPHLRQVMEYRSNTLKTTEIYNYFKKIIKFFERNAREVYFTTESNGIGEGVIALFENDTKHPISKAEFVSGDPRKGYGFHTSNKVKTRLVLQFKNLFEKECINIKSEQFLTEMKHYIRRGITYEANVGATDDCISAFLLILRIVENMSEFDADAFDTLYTLDVETGSAWGEEGKNEKDFDDTGGAYNQFPFHIMM